MQFVADLERDRTARCRSCMAWAESAISRSRSSTHLTGYEGARASPDRQRARSSSARTTCSGRCSTRSTSTRRSVGTSRSACGRCCRTRSSCAIAVWERARPGDLGGARRAQALRLLEADVLGRGRPRRPARRAAGREGAGTRNGRAVAGKIRADILERGVSERGVFRQHYETDALDASTLLIPLVRFLPPDDERVRATVLAIAEELQDNGFVLRYKVEETDDGSAGSRGHVPDLLVLAGFGAVGDRRGASGPRRCASACWRTPPR